MKLSTLASAITYSLTIALVGCSTMPNNMPLVFGEDISVGISMGASTTSQGGEFTLGFKSKDIAIIPVIASSGVNSTLIQSDITGPATGGTSSQKDAYSVIGQFSTATNSTGQKVGLGKFFATGAAAVRLSEGFATAMAASGVAGH